MGTSSRALGIKYVLGSASVADVHTIHFCDASNIRAKNGIWFRLTNKNIYVFTFRQSRNAAMSVHRGAIDLGKAHEFLLVSFQRSDRNIPIYDEMCMRIRGIFVLVFELFSRHVLHPDMDRGVFFDHGPMLGAKACGRLSERARFCPPGCFLEPSWCFLFFFRIGFKNIMERGVHILVERQRIFNLGSLIHVSSTEKNETTQKRTATVATARPPIWSPYVYSVCLIFLRCAA